MAITAQAFASVGSGAALVASQQLAVGGSDMLELAYRGFVTFTLDGATTSATINWIDGTATLGFTPTAVRVSVVGGTQPAAAQVQVQPTAFTNQTCTVGLSAAGTNANTLKLLVEVFK